MRMKPVLLATFLIACITALDVSAQAAPPARGTSAREIVLTQARIRLQAGKVAEARMALEPLRRINDPEGLYLLGQINEMEGEYFLAASNYIAASSFLYTPAMNQLAILLAEGRGLQRDLTRAGQLCRQAIVLGSADALANLAVLAIQYKIPLEANESPEALVKKAAEQGSAAGMRLHGQTLMLDVATRSEGLDWLNRAAKAGDPAAMVELAVALQKGTGVRRDLEAAATWLQSAADRGSRPALERLVAVYEFGLGVPADSARAAQLKSQLTLKPNQ
jgi:TPR repeat protein